MSAPTSLPSRGACRCEDGYPNPGSHVRHRVDGRHARNLVPLAAFALYRTRHAHSCHSSDRTQLTTGRINQSRASMASVCL